MFIDNDIVPQSRRSLFYTKKTPGVVILDNVESKDQNVVGVYIPRLMFGIDASKGPAEQTITLKNTSIINSKNKNIGKTSVKVRNYVLLPFFIIPNLAVPMYRKGEGVLIDFADNDIKSMFVLPYKMNEMNVRQTDLLSLYVPAKAKVDDEVGLDNIYALQFDSESKTVTLIMNKANGEVSRYFLQMNGEDGFIQLSDDNKRIVKLSTNTDEILLKNETETSISLKEGVLQIDCDQFILNAETETKITTDTFTTEAETITEKASTKETNADDLTINGSTYTVKYTTIKREGNSEENDFSGKVTVKTPIMGISGLVTAGGIGFEPVSLGQKPLPTSSSIDSTGMANFGKPAPMGMPLAVGPIVASGLKSLASSIDALCGALGIPPMQSTAMAMLEPQLNSKRVKG